MAGFGMAVQSGKCVSGSKAGTARIRTNVVPGFVLLVMMAAAQGSPPDLPDVSPPAIPPSVQTFRQWTERQHYATVGMFAPGGNITVVQSAQPVRIPFFVVTLKDSPPELVQDKPKIIELLKQRIFGTSDNAADSLQGYYNQLFRGKLSFFDVSDVIPLTLEGGISDYFNGKQPKRKLFEDLRDCLSRLTYPLEIYNNKQLNGQATDATTQEDVLDLVVIFVIARTDQGLWPLRWWYEWTTANGAQTDLSTPASAALALTDPISRKTVRLSNYCVLPIFGAAPDQDVIGYGFLAHEILHGFGLPDLYDRNNASAGCGGWCSMAWGMYAGVTAIPSNWQPPWNVKPVWPSVWCREFLSLDDRRTFRDWEASEGDIELSSPLNDTGKTFFRVDLPPLANPVAGYPECARYLLVEFRGPGLQKEGTVDWDDHLPGPGFLIWQVSENVGQRDPLTRGINKYWPCVYSQRPGHGNEGQNDVDDNPLVGLWRPDSPTLRNLDKAEILEQQHLWTEQDQVFKHPDGITLSNFRIAGKTGAFHYQIQPHHGSVAISTRNLASPQNVFQTQRSVSVSEAIGTPDVVAQAVPSEVTKQLTNVFAAYPRVEHSITNTKNELKSVALPASVSSVNTFAKDVASHVDLLNGKALGDTRAILISPKETAAKQALGKLYKGQQTVTKRVGVKIGNHVVPVAGARVDIQRDPDQPDRVRYFISNPPTLPDLPQTVKTAVSKVDVARFLRKRFRAVVPENTVELVVENGTGKLKWQCKVPTVPTSGPVTIEIDASDPNGLGTQTAIVIK